MAAFGRTSAGQRVGSGISADTQKLLDRQASSCLLLSAPPPFYALFPRRRCRHAAVVSSHVSASLDSMMKDAGINHKKAQSIKKTLSSTGSLPGSLPSTMSVGKQYSSTSSLGAHRPGAMNPRNADRGRKTKAAIDLVRARAIVTPALRHPVRHHHFTVSCLVLTTRSLFCSKSLATPRETDCP